GAGGPAGGPAAGGGVARAAPPAGGGHVFNLGHGISQHTPPDAVSALVDEVHRHSRALRQGV
ncbi:MAG: uroporphyrinogen decarboxylase family protein, partial [Aquincola tertiaricarbonis]